MTEAADAIPAFVGELTVSWLNSITVSRSIDGSSKFDADRKPACGGDGPAAISGACSAHIHASFGLAIRSDTVETLMKYCSGRRYLQLLVWPWRISRRRHSW